MTIMGGYQMPCNSSSLITKSSLILSLNSSSLSSMEISLKKFLEKSLKKLDF